MAGKQQRKAGKQLLADALSLRVLCCRYLPGLAGRVRVVIPGFVSSGAGCIRKSKF